MQCCCVRTRGREYARVQGALESRRSDTESFSPSDATYVERHGRHQLHLCATMLLPGIIFIHIENSNLRLLSGFDSRTRMQKIHGKKRSDRYVASRAQLSPPVCAHGKNFTRKTPRRDRTSGLQDAGWEQAHAPLQVPRCANAPTVRLTGLAAGSD